MFIPDRERVKKAFADYAARYDNANPKIKLKIDHTYRVAALCDAISDDIGLGEEDKGIAWCIGMLHDVGRFEQVRRYNTFSDANSVDHAALGIEVLFEEGHIRDYLPFAGRDALIHKAIACHNLYRLPTDLTEKELLFCKLIRDADKIDILKVNCITPMEEIYNTTTDALRQASLTPAVMDAFYEEHTILRSLRKTPIDHLISMMSLVYELEFPISLRLVKEQGCLDELMAYKSDNPDTAQKLTQAGAYMNRYISRSLT